ncbi:MAG: GDSL-type esterase/lipase family protein [Proteobacteria bacterium]|nr:GDSL-type esterase/lipase family protein [Pseudomonadota bacterium]
MILVRQQSNHGLHCYLLLSLLLICTSVNAADYPDPTKWDYTIKGFALEDEIVGKQSGAVVATGSSSMRFWGPRIHEDLAPLTIISRGFGGSNMNDVLYYLDELVLKHDPRAVLIYEGDNDVWQEVSSDTIIETYTKAIVKIHAHDPDIRVYMVSIKPSIDRKSMWPQMREINSAMKSIAESGDNLIYIDVASSMLEQDGSIMADIFVSDMLHLNQRGYDIWAEAIAPILLENELPFETTVQPGLPH